MVQNLSCAHAAPNDLLTIDVAGTHSAQSGYSYYIKPCLSWQTDIWCDFRGQKASMGVINEIPVLSAQWKQKRRAANPSGAVLKGKHNTRAWKSISHQMAWVLFFPDKGQKGLMKEFHFSYPASVGKAGEQKTERIPTCCTAHAAAENSKAACIYLWGWWKSWAACQDFILPSHDSKGQNMNITMLRAGLSWI